MQRIEYTTTAKNAAVQKEDLNTAENAVNDENSEILDEDLDLIRYQNCYELIEREIPLVPQDTTLATLGDELRILNLKMKNG